MTTYVWNFGSEAVGLQFSIQYDQGSNTFTVHCEKGHLDLNAIWLASDSVTGTYSLTKSESSLNMNGANTVWDDGASSSSKIVWDDFIALSSTGLGSEGTAKSTFISEGETACFNGTLFGFDAFDPTIFTTLGVRATSTSIGDGIKWVDAAGTRLNSAPVLATAIADQSSSEDEPWSFTVPSNTFLDPDGNAVTLSATLANGDPLPSWLSFNATTGMFLGTPPADFNGVISLKVTGSDEEFSADDTFDLTITPVNDAPTTALVTLAAISEDSGARIITQAELLANASDVEGDALTVSDVAIASGNGSLVNNGNGTWTYTPGLDDDTSVSLSYTITDNGTTNGLADPKDVPGSASLDITPVNDAPVASNETILVSSVTTFQMPVSWLLANDTDVEGNPLSIGLSGFQVVGSANNWVVTPHDDGSGKIDYFTVTAPTGGEITSTWSYTVSDGHDESPVAQVTFKSVSTSNGQNNIDLESQDYDFAYVDLKNQRDTGQSGSGYDVWKGGNGSDLFVFEPGDSDNVIVDFKAGPGGFVGTGNGGSNDGDQINVVAFGFTTLAQIVATDDFDTGQFGSGVKLQLDADTSVTLIGVASDELNANDFIFA